MIEIFSENELPPVSSTWKLVDILVLKQMNVQSTQPPNAPSNVCHFYLMQLYLTFNGDKKEDDVLEITSDEEPEAVAPVLRSSGGNTVGTTVNDDEGRPAAGALATEIVSVSTKNRSGQTDQTSESEVASTL